MTVLQLIKALNIAVDHGYGYANVNIVRFNNGIREMGKPRPVGGTIELPDKGFENINLREVP